MLKQEMPELMRDGKADPAFMAMSIIDQDGSRRADPISQQHALKARYGSAADLVNVQLVCNILHRNRPGTIWPAERQNLLRHDLRIADIA